MSFIEWSPDYSVGLPEFDTHHRHLFDLLNKAYDACMQSKQSEVFSDIVAEMSEYACYHFTAEERQMEACAYPGLTAHREEHLQFTRRIAELRKSLPTVNEECTIDLVDLTQFLMNWLSHHILEIDMQYSQHLSKC